MGQGHSYRTEIIALEAGKCAAGMQKQQALSHLLWRLNLKYREGQESLVQER